MKTPAFQFYVGDWKKDPSLSGVSLAAKGLWIEMICAMHESPLPGFLLNSAWKPPTLGSLTRTVGSSEDEVSSLLRELINAGVAHLCKRVCKTDAHVMQTEYAKAMQTECKLDADDPCNEDAVFFCLKMARKTLQAVHLTEVRREAANARWHGDESKTDANAQSKTDAKHAASSSSSSSSSVNTNPPLPPVSATDTAIADTAILIHSNHPKNRRDIGAKAIQPLLGKILRHKRLSGENAIEYLRILGARHAAWCNSPQWKKDGGEYAKGLTNWLAVTPERYEQEPPDTVVSIAAERNYPKPTSADVYANYDHDAARKHQMKMLAMKGIAG